MILSTTLVPNNDALNSSSLLDVLNPLLKAGNMAPKKGNLFQMIYFENMLRYFRSLLAVEYSSNTVELSLQEN